MRLKILIIVGLICLVLGSATVGTLSSYTTSSDYEIGIVPDSDWIDQQNQASQAKTQDAVQSSENPSDAGVEKNQDSKAPDKAAGGDESDHSSKTAAPENKNTSTESNTSNSETSEAKGAGSEARSGSLNEKKDSSLQDDHGDVSIGRESNSEGAVIENGQ